MDIVFRPGNFARDPAYSTEPIYRSQANILIVPNVPGPGNPGAMINEPSISAELSPNDLFPVRGFVTGTALWRPIQQAPGQPYINELWFSISYNVMVRQPLGWYNGPHATHYAPEQPLYGSSFVVKLPAVSFSTVQHC